MAETWVGFRPGSRDDAPILGPSGVAGLVLATGHHRNGILLTPLTAQIITAYVLTGHLPEVAQPFTPERFGAHDRRSTAKIVRTAAGTGLELPAVAFRLVEDALRELLRGRTRLHLGGGSGHRVDPQVVARGVGREHEEARAVR